MCFIQNSDRNSGVERCVSIIMVRAKRCSCHNLFRVYDV